MANIYFIGGTPRVGKTTLLQKFLERKPIRSLSTDALRHALQQIIKPEDEPDLFASGAFIGADAATRRDIRLSPERVVAEQNSESFVVWKSVVDYIESVTSDGADIVIEGVAVLPELLMQSKLEGYHCVFIGNSSVGHTARILRAARHNEYDWLHDVPDDIVKAFGQFSQKFSEYLRGETEKYNLPYVEIDDEHYEQSLERALTLLGVEQP